MGARPRTRRGQVQAAQVGAQVEAPLAPLALVPRQKLAELAVVEALPQASTISTGRQESACGAGCTSICTATAWGVAHICILAIE